jgi:uncharacterized protein (DUF305 family)
MRNLLAASFGLALAVTPFAAHAQPATAMSPMPDMDVSSVDCSSAPTHMMSMMSAPPGAMADTTPSSDTDKTYTDAMKMMLKHAAMMAKIEMKCGKNAKAVALAKKMLSEINDDYLTVEAVPTGGF